MVPRATARGAKAWLIPLLSSERLVRAALAARELAALEAAAPPAKPATGPAKDAERVRKLRVRQLGRIARLIESAERLQESTP